MFERFTDRARTVLVLAQEEARQLNHSFIGTEHILLGLVSEGQGLGAQALNSLGISPEAVRQKVTEAVGAMAGAPDGGSPPFTPRAKKVLELALREALQLGHSYIGTEHILLGLIREGDGVAAAVLTELGVEPFRVRQEVIRLMSTGPAQELRGEGWRRTKATGPAAEGTPGGAEPRCPNCQAGLAEVARFRTIDVAPDDEDSPRRPIPVDVVYCTGCGTTLHMFRSDDPGSVTG